VSASDPHDAGPAGQPEPQALPPLSMATLHLARAGTERFGYDRRQLRAGIVHIGLGAFARAHILSYVETLLADEPHWGIIGASLKRASTRAALAPQDGLYTLLVRDGEECESRLIGGLLGLLDNRLEGPALLARLAHADTRIVTVTVTEKGYCHDPATGRLDPGHPDIVHDLEHPTSPISLPGLLLRAIELRQAAGLPAFTALSCDNLHGNGRTLRRVILDLAALRNPDLAAHVEAEIGFPCSMVDRIVPATTDADRDAAAALTGLADAWPVVTEPFTQWVIEDRFAAGRPAFERAGVEMVSDVLPYERMKLRILNASHTALAWLGMRRGHTFVHEAIADPELFAHVHDMVTGEVMPALALPADRLAAYRDRVLARFANHALQHRLQQIGTDTSQKLPQRVLDSVRANRARGAPYARLAGVVAAWIVSLSRAGELPADPLAAALRGAARQGPEAVLAMEPVFGDLAGDAAFAATVRRAMTG
jgi:fructuronate reductase